jgi:cation diffusion facilitator CzcD-associated flavoprotein CzcO
VPRYIILGAGVAGLCFAMQLCRAGQRDFVILEKGERLGGTWRDNVYPGSGCDIPSHLYCFSFEPNPDWSRKYAEQGEILAYLERCAAKHDLGRHIRFGAEVASARWDEGGSRWEVRTRSGEVLRGDYFISATGQLNRPAVPAIEGAEEFGGQRFHSARWQAGHDLRGRRVGVIGNGASAIQLLPPVAEAAAAVTVFQRTPAWVVKKPDRPYRASERWLFRRVPWLMSAHRYAIYWELEARFTAFGKGSLVNRLGTRLATKELEQIADPELRAKLTPDYPLGCKRILISNDYYAAIQRPHVSLETDAIARFTREGLLTRGGRHHDLDTVIYATGFESLRFLAPVEIVGRHGRLLSESWQKGAEAYLGVAVAGFPNFFILYGPNTNLGHNSIIFMVECQTNYVLALLERMDQKRLTHIEVRAEVQRRYNELLAAKLERTVWNAGCKNWYTTAEGRNTNNWASFTSSYWWRTRKPDLSAYHMA